MKQIFDWLREQTEINKKDAEQRYERQLEISSTIAPHYGGKISAYCEMLDLVSQGEAKWEADKVNQLAMMYAVALTKYGVDIREKLETATQITMALNEAYLRGRHDERIKISEVE